MSTKKRKQKRKLDDVNREPRLVTFNGRMRVTFALENTRALLHLGIRDVHVEVEAWERDELIATTKELIGDAAVELFDRLKGAT